MRKKKYNRNIVIVICLVILFSGFIGLHKKYMNQIVPSANKEMTEKEYDYMKEQTYTSQYTGNYKKNKQIFFKNEQFDCVATFGFEGIIYEDATFPVQVSVTNKGEDINGTICIIVPEGLGKKGVSIAKELKLSKNETKTLYLDVPKITMKNQCKIMILEQENVLLEQNIRDEFQYDTHGSVLLGTMSKNIQQYNYMDQIMLSWNASNSLRVISFSKETFPDELEILRHLQYIIFDREQMVEISKKQKDSFIQWVEQGGVVLCCNTQDYDALYSMLNHSKINQKENLYIQLIQSNYEIKNFEYELGKIVILPKEIVDKNKEFSEKREFIETFFYKINEGKTYLGRFLNMSYLSEQTLEFHYDIKLPKTRVYFSILVLYIICVAPIGYFVLKRIDKREWIGFWIIGFAVVFHSIILFISSNSTLKEPVGTMVAIVDGSNKKWDEDLYTSWINPTRYPYSIKFSGEYNSIYPFYDNYYDNSPKIRLEKIRYFMKKNEKNTHIVVSNSDIFDRECFVAERVYDQNKIAFENALHFEEGGITGTVTNNTGADLWGAGVYFDGYYISLGDWKSGETKTITLDQNYVILNDKDISRADLVSIFTENIGEDRKNNIQTLRRTEDLYSFLKHKYIDLEFENAIIFGVSDEYKNASKIETSVKIKAKTLYFTKTKGLERKGSGSFIPNIMANRIILSDSSNFDLSENTYQGQDDTIIYQFKPNFELKELHSSGLTNELKDDYNLSIYIWNNATQHYDEIFKDNKKIGGKNIKNYVRNNQIKLRFTSNGYGLELPTISAVGGEKNVRIKTIN